MRIALAVVAAVSLSALLVTAVATAGDKAPTADTRPAGGVAAEDVEAIETYARWACVLAGLSLAGVIWVGWSMRTLATNQVALAKLIEQARREQ